MSESIGVGSEVGGYRVTSLIGRGGMGAVYLVEEPTTGEQFALKLLLAEHSSSEEFRKRFGRESRYARALKHPNIIAVHEVGEADDFLYMVMDYVPGADLAARLVDRGRLDLAETTEILRQVGDALDSVHAGGLFHRDVKPANIVLVDSADPARPHAYLTDFGLSKAPSKDSGPLTALGFFVGTSAYTAPEQIRSEDVDGRVDVYSLGCVLYECLVGTTPFPRAAEEQVLLAHIQDPPPKLSDQRPDLPAALDAVVATAMAKDPADRFPTCTAMVEAAAAVLGPEAPAAGAPARGAAAGPIPPVLLLRVTAGPAAGAEIAVTDEFEIGREAPGDGRLGDDPELSRRHARVYRSPDGWEVEDLGSTNGTLVNDVAIGAPALVAAGDTVQLGDTTIEIAAGAPIADEPGPLSVTLRFDPASGRLVVECGPDSVTFQLTYEEGEWRLPA